MYNRALSVAFMNLRTRRDNDRFCYVYRTPRKGLCSCFEQRVAAITNSLLQIARKYDVFDISSNVRTFVQ